MAHDPNQRLVLPPLPRSQHTVALTCLTWVYSARIIPGRQQPGFFLLDVGATLLEKGAPQTPSQNFFPFCGFRKTLQCNKL